MLSNVTLEWKKYQSSGRNPSPVYMILLAVRCLTGVKVGAAGSGVGVRASSTRTLPRVISTASRNTRASATYTFRSDHSCGDTEQGRCLGPVWIMV